MGDWCEVNEKYYRHEKKGPTQEEFRLKSLCLPTQTEIRTRFGPKLADVFFESLSSDGRIYLGLEPPLTGPAEVWVDPSSRLKNEVRFSPVPEPYVVHQKAFTHQAILELGKMYADSLVRRMKDEAADALKSQGQELEVEFNKRIYKALGDAKLEADEHCKQVVGTLMEHFDRCFAEIIETHKLRMRKHCQLRVQEERAELGAYMLAQLQQEVEKRDLELCSDFHDTLNGELNALAAKYIKQIDKERKVAREVLEEVIRKYETMLVDLRSEMEIGSFVDVCRAIAEERAKNERGAEGAEEENAKQIGSFKKRIQDLTDRNRTLQQMATERAERIKQYRKKMKGLIEEFQKFINFALGAAPAHAEFLLSTQKMIMKKYHQDGLLRPDDYENFTNCLRGKLPSEEDEKASSESLVEETAASAGGKSKGVEDPQTKCKKEEESKYAFNYYRFKYSLLKNLIKGIKFESEFGKVTPETKPCVKRVEKTEKNKNGEDEDEEEEEEEEEEGEELLGDESEGGLKQYKESLVLAGENVKEHLQPIETFLKDRMKSISELCKNDPELVRMMLGCV